MWLALKILQHLWDSRMKKWKMREESAKWRDKNEWERMNWKLWEPNWKIICTKLCEFRSRLDPHGLAIRHAFPSVALASPSVQLVDSPLSGGGRAIFAGASSFVSSYSSGLFSSSVIIFFVRDVNKLKW